MTTNSNRIPKLIYPSECSEFPRWQTHTGPGADESWATPLPTDRERCERWHAAFNAALGSFWAATTLARSADEPLTAEDLARYIAEAVAMADAIHGGGFVRGEK